jgi:hypothetical protein
VGRNKHNLLRWVGVWEGGLHVCVWGGGRVWQRWGGGGALEPACLCVWTRGRVILRKGRKLVGDDGCCSSLAPIVMWLWCADDETHRYLCVSVEGCGAPAPPGVGCHSPR